MKSRIGAIVLLTALSAAFSVPALASGSGASDGPRATSAPAGGSDDHVHPAITGWQLFTCVTFLYNCPKGIFDGPPNGY